jgi:hypothetical protein
MERSQRRAVRDEQWSLVYGIRGTKGQKGVGILLHKRWRDAMRAFRPVNERICWAEMDTGEKQLAFIAIYMPHGGCPDHEVEQSGDASATSRTYSPCMWRLECGGRETTGR